MRAFFISLMIMFSLLAGTESQAQETSKTLPGSFIIHGNYDSAKMDFFRKSIEKANFEQYRLKDANVVLTFKNGFTLELLSAKECAMKGISKSFNPNMYAERNSFPSDFFYPIFEIVSNGWVLAEVQSKSKSK